MALSVVRQDMATAGAEEGSVPPWAATTAAREGMSSLKPDWSEAAPGMGKIWLQRREAAAGKAGGRAKAQMH